jgi:hypothetical protein
MQPFEAYRTYLAMKNHFSQKGYDYFKYQGKVNVGQSSFDTRKDKYLFHKLSKHKDPERYLVANFINRDVKWLGDLLDETAEKTYTDWLKRQQSLTYNFQQELNNLESDFQNNLIVKDGQHPLLLKLYRQGIVSIETMVILNSLVNFFPYWNREITDTVLWPELHNKIQKYKPFVDFDFEKCKKILNSAFDL